MPRSNDAVGVCGQDEAGITSQPPSSCTEHLLGGTRKMQSCRRLSLGRRSNNHLVCCAARPAHRAMGQPRAGDNDLCQTRQKARPRGRADLCHCHASSLLHVTWPPKPMLETSSFSYRHLPAHPSCTAIDWSSHVDCLSEIDLITVPQLICDQWRLCSSALNSKFETDSPPAKEGLHIYP
eukprot:511518-Rhodomonas_salina.2